MCATSGELWSGFVSNDVFDLFFTFSWYFCFYYLLHIRIRRFRCECWLTICFTSFATPVACRLSQTSSRAEERGLYLIQFQCLPRNVFVFACRPKYLLFPCSSLVANEDATTAAACHSAHLSRSSHIHIYSTALPQPQVSCGLMPQALSPPSQPTRPPNAAHEVSSGGLIE